jgi:tetratricopeptide (TPR) repeat protein
MLNAYVQSIINCSNPHFFNDMKRIYLFIGFILFVCSNSFSQMDKIKQANELYAQGNYQLAAKQYESILTNDGVSPALYYNAGNAYYKTKEIGRSILNYERALRLLPSFEDARYNLELAQLKVVDNVVQAPTFFLLSWVASLLKFFTSNQWLFGSLVLFLLCLITAFIFVFGPSQSVRKLSFYFTLCFLAISLLILVFAGIRKDQLVNHDEAIVMSGIVTVKSSPDVSGTDLFQLHEGTKVHIKSVLGKWTEIELGNGSIGWVEQMHVEVI